MKKLSGVLIISIGFVLSAVAQDEGVITKKARIDKANNIFLGLGPSFTFGKNIGDYSTGFNVELGFMKRLNRVLSIGPSISYLSFKYDPEKTKPEDDSEAGFYQGSGDIDTDWYDSEYGSWNNKYELNESYDYGYVLALEGGDVSLISLAVNLKLNFVPVRDHSIVSFYVFAKPFVTSTQRKEVSGTGTMYVYEAYEEFNGTPNNEQDDILYYNQGDDTWYATGYVDRWGAAGYPELKKKSSVSGGVFIGPGVEFFPAKRLSFYLQPMIGYTFPISFVSTKSFDNTMKSYTDPAFPIVKKGFTSLTVQVGASFNF
jgi:hypothetical protein